MLYVYNLNQMRICLYDQSWILNVLYINIYIIIYKYIIYIFDIQIFQLFLNCAPTVGLATQF